MAEDNFTEEEVDPPRTAVLSLNGWAALSTVARTIERHPNTLKRWGKSGMIDIKMVGRRYFVRPEQFAKVST